jgi:hypothetical protein
VLDTNRIRAGNSDLRETHSIIKSIDTYGGETNARRSRQRVGTKQLRQISGYIQPNQNMPELRRIEHVQVGKLE